MSDDPRPRKKLVIKPTTAAAVLRATEARRRQEVEAGKATASQFSTTMAARILAAARQSASFHRISSHKPLPQLLQRRGLAGSADNHGPQKVDCWKEPTNPGNWKEEHFVIVSLAGWGLAIFGGYKLFSGGKGKKEEKVVQASQ